MATIHYKDNAQVLKCQMAIVILIAHGYGTPNYCSALYGYGTMTTESSTSATANHPDTKSNPVTLTLLLNSLQ